MSAQANVNDKIGNVLASTGITVLALPYDTSSQYLRLNDATPNFASGVMTVPFSQIQDDQHSLHYVSTLSGGATVTSSAGPFFTFNVDSVEEALSTSISFYGVIPATSITIDYYSPFGQRVASSLFQLGAITGNQTITDVIIPTEPIGAMKLSTSVAIPGLIETVVDVTVPNGGQPGCTMPISVVAYEGLPSASTMTISGVRNFELIPNPNLMKNLPIDYGRFDPHELNYVKLVLAHRDKLGLRTVMTREMYAELRARLLAYTQVDESEMAEAFDWGSLLRTIKNIAVPALSAVFPGAAPLVSSVGNAVGGIIDSVFSKSNAASGRVIGYAADMDLSGYEIVGTDKRRKSEVEEGIWRILDPKPSSVEGVKTPLLPPHRKLDTIKEEEEVIETRQEDQPTQPITLKAPKVWALACDNDVSPQGVIMDNGVTNILTSPAFPEESGLLTTVQSPTTRKLVIGFEGDARSAVPFPVVMTRNGLPSGIRMYVAVPGNHTKLLSEYALTHTTRSKNGYTVHGYSADELAFNLSSDVTLLPLKTMNAGYIIVECNGVPVAGGSCETALAILDRATPGVVRPVTGDVLMVSFPMKGTYTMPNPSYNVKEIYTTQCGLPLIGVGLGAKPLALASILNKVNVPLNRDIVYNFPVRELALQGGHELAMAASGYVTMDDLNGILDRKLADAMNPFMARLEQALAGKQQPSITFEHPTETAPPSQWEVPVPLVHSGPLDLTDTEVDTVNWLQVSGVLDLLTAHRLNKTPASYFVALISKAITPSRERGPTQQEAQSASLMALYTKLRVQYPTITEEWIRLNGRRGPSDIQAQYWRMYKKLPAPGQALLDEKGEPTFTPPPTAQRTPMISPVSPADKMIIRMNNMIRSSALNEEAAQRLKDYVADNNHLPDATDFKQLILMTSDKPKKSSALIEKMKQYNSMKQGDMV